MLNDTLIGPLLFLILCAAGAGFLLWLGQRLLRVTRPRYYKGLLSDSTRALQERRLDNARKLVERGLKDINSLRSLTPELTEAKGELLVQLGQVREALGDVAQAAQAYRLAALLIELPSPALRLLVVEDLKANNAGVDAVRRYLAYLYQHPESTSANDPLVAQLGNPTLIDNITARESLPLWITLAKDLSTQRKMGGGWVWHILARAQALSGQIEEAIKTLYREAQKNHLSPAELNYLGQLSAGDPQMSLYAYRESLHRDPTQTALLHAIAGVLIDSAKTQPEQRPALLAEAAQYLQKACSQEDGHADWWRALGEANLGLNDLAGAQAALQRATALDPSDARGFALLGEVLLALNEDAAAEPALIRAAELDPTFEAWKRAGLHSLKLAHWEKAVMALQASLKLNSRQMNVHLALGMALYRLARWGDVIATLSAQKSLPLADARRLARAQMHAGQYAQAIVTYQQCLQQAEPAAQMQLELGFAHHALGQWREAVNALAPVKGHPRAATLLAHAHLQLNEVDAARKVAMAAEMSGEAAPAALHIFASVYFAAGDLAEAERCWRAIAGVDEYALQAQLGYAAIHELRGEFNAALQGYERARQMRPEWKPALLRLGICQVRLDQWAEARSTLEKISPVALADGEGALCFAAAYLQTEQWQPAHQLLKALNLTGMNAGVARNNTYVARHHLAEQAAQAGNYKNAASWWEMNYLDHPEITGIAGNLVKVYLALALTQLKSAADYAGYTDFDATVNRLSELAPNSIQNTLLRALALLQDNHAQRALSLLRPVADRLSRPDERFALALCYWGTLQPRLAMDLLATLDMPLACWQVPVMRGVRHAKEGDWPAAANAFGAAITATRCDGSTPIPKSKLLDILRNYVIVSINANRTDQATAFLEALCEDSFEGFAACAKVSLAALKLIAGDAEAAQMLLTPELLLFWQGERWAEVLAQGVHLSSALRFARAHDWQDAWQKLAAGQINDDNLLKLKALIGYQWARNTGERDNASIDPEAVRTALSAGLFCAPALHGLAVLAFHAAVALGEASPTSPQVETAWDFAIAAWLGLIYSAGFWSSWNAGREKAAGILLSDDELRDLGDTVLARIDEQLNRLRSAGANNDRIKLLKARVEHEKTCALLMREHLQTAHVGSWPAGMVCGTRMTELSQDHKCSTAFGESLRVPTPVASKLSRYLQQSDEGFITYLTENGQPRLAVDLLLASPAGLSEDQRKQLKSRAYLALGQQLAASGENWKTALESFRRARELGAFVAGVREQVVLCGIERSREILKAEPAKTDEALQALQTAKDIAGNEPRLASNIAAIYTQKAQMAFSANNLMEAARLFRIALSHSNEAGTRQLFAGVLDTQASQLAIGQRNRVQAIAVAREMLQMKEGLDQPATETVARNWIKERFMRYIGALWKASEAASEEFDLRLALGLISEARWYADEQNARGLHAVLLDEQSRLYSLQNQWNASIETLNQAYQLERTSERCKRMALLFAARAETKLNNNNRSGALADVRTALEWDPNNYGLWQFQQQILR